VDRRTAQGSDTSERVEARAPQVDFLRAHLRQIGAAKVRAGKGNRVELRTLNLCTLQVTVFELHSSEARHSKVRVIESTRSEGDVAQLRLGELDRAQTAVDQANRSPDRLGKVAARQVAAHELDIDQSTSGEVFARVARAFYAYAFGFAFVEHQRVARN